MSGSGIRATIEATQILEQRDPELAEKMARCCALSQSEAREESRRCR
jgi:hypothetical protein